MDQAPQTTSTSNRELTGLALAKKLAGRLSVVSLDPIHIIGYIGAPGSVLFGGNQLRLILAKGSARDVSVFDYVLRVGYSVLLGVYAVGTRDLVFTVVNLPPRCCRRQWLP